MDPLFPELPEDLTSLSDEDLANLLREHEVAAELIDADDEEFTAGLEADDVLAQYEAGVEQIEAIKAEQKARVDAQAEYLARKETLSTRRKGADEDPGDEDGKIEELSAESEPEPDPEPEPEGDGDESGDEEPAAEEALVASAEESEEKPKEKRLRRPPAASTERFAEKGAVLVAAAGIPDVHGGAPLSRERYAKIVRLEGIRRGTPSKSAVGVEEKIRLARAEFPFPDDRRLTGDIDENTRKILAVVPDYIPGIYGEMRGNALVASGGLCAPLEPIYSMPNFASMARPVRDSIPSFQADRGGVNVPTATDIGDITTAISVIEEADDAEGGTFATKSCQDLDCPAYTEVPVTIIAHCREYGNLNARAWPEKIAHENDLTMAAHARAAEGYLLDRIKALSIQVTQAEVLGAYGDLVHAVTKAAAGIRFRLRMNLGARFRLLLPGYLPDLLAADTAYTQFDRFQPQAQMVSHLESLGFAATFYMDDIGDGTSQGFAAESAGALDDYPDDLQYAIFPEGEFIHVDGGSLELGIVRDSTLNSTNDFQLFGETFENVARLGPAQGALWITQGICPSGESPALGTALSC